MTRSIPNATTRRHSIGPLPRRRSQTLDTAVDERAEWSVHVLDSPLPTLLTPQTRARNSIPRSFRAGRRGQRETDFTSGQLNCGSEGLEAAKLQILNKKEFWQTSWGFLGGGE